MSVVGRVLLLVASLAMLHSAFSAYEHLSLLKAAGKPETSLPSDIVLETLLALVLGTFGASLSTPSLHKITWQEEMKTRSWEEMSTRLGFADWGAHAKDITTKSS